MTLASVEFSFRKFSRAHENKECQSRVPKVHAANALKILKHCYILLDFKLWESKPPYFQNLTAPNRNYWGDWKVLLLLAGPFHTPRGTPAPRGMVTSPFLPRLTCSMRTSSWPIIRAVPYDQSQNQSQPGFSRLPSDTVQLFFSSFSFSQQIIA